MKRANGEQRPMQCDKDGVRVIMEKMIKKHRAYHLELNNLLHYRCFSALAVSFVQGLPSIDTPTMGLTEFLAEYKFSSPREDENQGSGFSPLILSAAAGHLAVVEQLLDVGADPNARTQVVINLLGSEKGATALSVAASCCPRNQVYEIVTRLLRAGADPNSPNQNGVTPLMFAVGFHNLEGVRALISCAGGLDLERGMNINNATALGIAAFMSTADIVEALIEAGANVAHIEGGGGTKLTDACSNPAVDSRLLELVHRPGTINDQMKARTTFWAAVDFWFRSLVRHRMSRAHLAMGRAHCQGSTALHMAARQGNVATTRWLLERGAQPSLLLKNRMGVSRDFAYHEHAKTHTLRQNSFHNVSTGCAPIDMAHIFGPHLQV